MTMFLFNTIQAEVEPVPGQPGWFQLTGKKILRNGMDPTELIQELAEYGVLVEDPKLLGVNDIDDEIEYKDPRFADLDEPGFAVAKEKDGTYTAYLACNRAEFAFFRFAIPDEAGEPHDEEFDPISTYRKEA
jgi:hypothetical protein